MSWAYLLTAISLEVCGTTCLKLSQGMSRLVPTVLVFVFYAGSFWCLAMALKRIDIGVAYAIWAGLGTAAIAVIGWAFFQETLTVFKVLCIGLIIAGVVGLKLQTKAG